MSRLVRRQRSLWCAALAVVCAFLFPSPVSAVIPVSETDDELAKTPIVVAKWTKTPLKAHELIEGNATRQSETHTELVVECVLRGDVELGKQKLLLSYPIGWEKKGGPIIAYSSTMMVGDVAEVADPNLWFLSRHKSWDEKDKHEYLYLSTYRNVQPSALKHYFEALMSDDPSTKMADAFRSSEQLVLRRCLEFAAGGGSPWPLKEPDPFSFLAPQIGRPPVTALTAETERLLDNPKSPERPLATAVYARLAGAKSLPRLRKLLGDKNAEVRATALALLAKHRDEESCDAMCRAAADIDDALLGCAIVEAVGEWKDERLVPVLIALLQNDAMAYRSGDDWGIPALKAQQMLTRMAGYTFPFEVKAGLKSWEEAKAIRDPKARRAFLARAVPFDPQPLKANYSYDAKRLAVTVTNRSARPVTLSKLPAAIDVRYNGHSSIDYGDADDATSFVSVEPGKSRQFKVDFDEYPPEPPLTEVKIFYTHNGNEVGENAWLGMIEVQPAKSDAKDKAAPKDAGK